MTKHTPGPWEVDNDEIMANGFYVATCRGYAGFDSDDNTLFANTCLIAAAPDLLEFAEEVRRTGDSRLASMAIAIINKATGEKL